MGALREGSAFRSRVYGIQQPAGVSSLRRVELAHASGGSGGHSGASRADATSASHIQSASHTGTSYPVSCMQKKPRTQAQHRALDIGGSSLSAVPSTEPRYLLLWD